jgi:hypothetical protein
MDGAQSAVTPAPAAPASTDAPAQGQQPVTETPKPFHTAKMNINGKIVEKSWNSLDDMVRDAQKAEGIEAKAQQHAGKVKAAETLIKLLNDPSEAGQRKLVQICKENNINLEKLMYDLAYNKIQYEKMSPEQRELYDLKQKEADRQQIENEEKERVETEAKAKKVSEWQQRFEKECIAALQSKQVPSSRLSLALIAQYADAALSNKQEVNVDDIIPFVQRDLQQLNQQTLMTLEGKALLDYLGPELLAKISKAKVTDYKDTVLTPKKEAPKVKTPSQGAKKRPSPRFGW